jgi:hypothetical protein
VLIELWALILFCGNGGGESICLEIDRGELSIVKGANEYMEFLPREYL